MYHKESWNYVFGLGSRATGTGVFSFARYDPGEGAPNREYLWLRRSVNVMVHEIGHMFGIRHCIYYECTMNGVMHGDEGTRRADHTLCPICLKKLQCNIKFDPEKRFDKLIEVATKLNFETEVNFYAKLLSLIQN